MSLCLGRVRAQVAAILRGLLLIALSAGDCTSQELQHLRTVPPPDNFDGHLAYDAASKRLWLISYGPPANRSGASKVMEVDPRSGRMLAEAKLPLLGGFAPPVVVGGYLYQPVNFESRIYKIAVADRARLGRVESTLPIPLVSDLRPGGSEPGAEPLKFPWLEVSGMAVAPDGNLLLHAADLGELVTLDRESGRMVKRMRTMKGLGGIASVIAPGGRFYILANLDLDDAAARDKARRFDLRAPEVVPWKRSKVTLFSHRHDRKTLTWILLDGESGEPLASVEDDPSPAYASATAIADFQPAREGYGSFTFLAMGPAGVLTMRWSPESGMK